MFTTFYSYNSSSPILNINPKLSIRFFHITGINWFRIFVLRKANITWAYWHFSLLNTKNKVSHPSNNVSIMGKLKVHLILQITWVS